MSKLVTTTICLLLLALAIGGAIAFVKTAPKAERKQPPKMAPLVESHPLKAARQTVVLELTGTIVPAEEITLFAQVSGEVVAMDPDFIEGGIIKKGADILQIEPVDYKLALASTQSSLVTAQFNHKMELGRQDVAKREWELLKTEDASELEKELALRIPHLAASEASLLAAESALEKAQLNLSRTRIKTPFNALVLERNVNLGSIDQQLGRLVGTDVYWAQVSIPVDRLGWVTIPGSTVRIISPSGAEREGTVIKLLGDLEAQGRMARLLVEIQDPLCIKPENQNKKPLLLGEYVRAEISGRVLDNTFSIPRNSLREGGVIWLATNEGKLDIRDVEVLWRDAHTVLVKNGISDGELLITSDLTTPINGMDVNAGNGPSAGAKKKNPANKE